MHTPRGCVYCTSTEHRAVNCTKVTDVSQRKSILASKRLCFNNVRAHTEQHYARAKHLVTLALGKHHTSICEKLQMLLPARNQA